MQWKDRYNIGYKDIDRQHRGLLDILNEAISLKEQSPDSERNRALFSRLIAYVRSHFRYEEFYMKKSDFPDLAGHVKSHQYFVKKLLELNDRYEAENPLLVAETVVFLQDWYINHIMNQDQDYGPYFKKLRGNMPLAGLVFDYGMVIDSFDNQVFIESLAGMSGRNAVDLERALYREGDLMLRYERGEIDSPAFYREALRQADLEISLDDFRRAYLSIFTPISATRELLPQLAQNYTLGLISNTGEWHAEYIVGQQDLASWFKVMVFSCRAGIMKPDPGIYEICLEGLGLLAEECVYIDDLPANAAAADELRFHALRFRDGESLRRDLKALGIKIS